jgi:small subunit ribosomal protein S3Ae
LTDLKKVDQGAEKAYRKIKLVVEDVEGAACYTNFHSMDITRDKLFSLMRKWQTTIEAHVDVKTKDDYFLRLFLICFTSRVQRQLRATSYATASKIKLIRKRITEIIMNHVQKNTLKSIVPILMEEKIEEEIKKACAKFYPLQNIIIRKAKVLKKPRFDVSKRIEFYGERTALGTEILSAPAAEEPKNLLADTAPKK